MSILGRAIRGFGDHDIFKSAIAADFIFCKWLMLQLLLIIYLKEGGD